MPNLIHERELRALLTESKGFVALADKYGHKRNPPSLRQPAPPTPPLIPTCTRTERLTHSLKSTNMPAPIRQAHAR